MKIFIASLALVIIFISMLIIAGDRTCQKQNFSKEFKQTQEYKDMHCPETTK